jgi:hypothetical protein
LLKGQQEYLEPAAKGSLQDRRFDTAAEVWGTIDWVECDKKSVQ